MNPISVDDIKRNAQHELQAIMDRWCVNHSNNVTGGQMRSTRGEDIETFVRNIVDSIGMASNKNLVALRGSNDKKQLKLTIEGRTFIHEHQVDVHIYLNQKFVAVIECKAYLDSCYYVRACDDFTKFQKFGYDHVKKYIFTLENSIDENTKVFTDHFTGHICNEIFCVRDGKRSSSKPIYDERFKKQINIPFLNHFIDALYALCEENEIESSVESSV